ncbi:Protoheme IX farnesyltransferase mitochondrial [Taenia solium]|eukprot:TsM_000306200 transcript=TsM_000306200 gene=TsM_000306200
MPSIKLKKSSKRYRTDPELRRSVGRAAPGSVERLQYLEALVNELCVTNLIDYKQQIVANLGNFAHDPRNCPQLISLDVHLILLEIIREHLQIALSPSSQKKSAAASAKLVSLAVAGICNLITSSQNLRLRFSHNPQELSPVLNCMQSPALEAGTLVNCLTVFVHLCAPSVHLREQDCVFFEPNCSTTAFHTSIRNHFPAVVEFARGLLAGNTEDPRLRNLATIFLTDSCGDTCAKSAVLSPASRSDRSPVGPVKWMSVWAALSKARLTGLVVSTALAGCALAAPSPLVCEAFLAHPATSLLALGVGTMLTSASANSINQIMEVQYDGLMKRTRMRPLVRKLIGPVGASVFASTTAALGLSILYVGTNSLVASMAAGNLLLYTCVYTPLKRVSQVNTWVGSLVGAIPPLMGWAAATGSLHTGSLVLACLLYAWQFPHFMSLSWLARREYAQAGYVMTANVTPQRARAAALRHSLLASLICFLGAGGESAGQVSWCGGLVAAPFNAMLVYYAVRFYSTPLENAGAVCSAARGLFRVSLLHLPAVMTVLLVCSHCGFATG